ncbi:hypothetical protein [uncultured Amnibacterium sp.]|uniref:hypothetical protein n=1 Tax=uncultured Amnibacterium sp. TaxID=1631851 RepID=UPI0035CB3670
MTAPASTRRQVVARIVRRRALLIVLLVLNLAITTIYSLQTAVVLPTYHLDGAFQTASGLIRLSHGNLPGRDFFPYLGIGPVFLLFPLFWIMGGTLGASAFSAHFVTVAVLELVAGLVFVLILRRRSFTALLGVGSVVLLLIVFSATPPLWLPNQVQTVLTALYSSAIPGNSLRPVRASSPMVLTGTALLALRYLPRYRAIAVVGVVAGIVLALWSNDFALAPVAIFLAFMAYYGLRLRRWRLREFGVLALALGVAYVVSGLIATGGFFAAQLTYNFRDVLGDQNWYFGGWQAADRVYSLHDLLFTFRTYKVIPFLPALPVATFFALFRRPGLTSILAAYLGWAAMLGGLTALIGGHLDDYFLPYRLWASVATIAYIVVFVRWVIAKLSASDRRRPGRTGTPRRPPRSLVWVFAVVPVVALVVQIGSYAGYRQGVVADTSDYGYNPILGGYLNRVFDDHVAALPTKGTSFIEEYAGLWTAESGPNEHVKVDSVIHALGAERDNFAAYMGTNPDEVVTTAKELSYGWVSWNISANWWFYRDLFRNYAPQADSPYTVVWKHVGPSPVAPTAGTCTVASDGQSVRVAPGITGLGELTVEYAGPGRGSRGFSMIQNDINSAVDADGFVALDPGAHAQRVPVYSRNLVPRKLVVRDVPAGKHTTITGCTITSVPVPAASRALSLYRDFWTISTRPLAVTDASWLNGLFRGDAAGFQVKNTGPNAIAFAPGKTVTLADGEHRTVTSAVSADKLFVYLTGPALPQSLLSSTNAFNAGDSIAEPG